MAYGLKYTASAYGLSSVEWKVELLENGYSGTSSNIQLIGNGIKIGYDKEDDRFNLIYSRYAIIDLKVTSTFNLDSLQFDDERKFQVKIYKNDVLEFIGWLIPFYSSQEFEDTSLATISIQAKDGINQLKNIAFYNSNPTAISFKQSFKDIISQSLLQTGYELDLEIFYNKYDASMAKSTSDCPLAQLYFNINTLSKNENEWHDFYEVLNRLLSIHNLRLFQTNGKWTIIDQMDLIEGVIYGRKYNSAGVYQSNVTLNSDTLIHTGGLKVKSNSIIRKDVPFKQYSAFFNAGALSNLLKNGELTSFNGSMPNGWTKVGTWAYGSYGANVIDGVTNGIKFQNKYTQSLNYDDSAYFESEEIDISSYNAFTLDFEAYADATIDAIKIGIKLYDNTGTSTTEYFVDKNGIPRIDGRSALIEKGFLDTFFKFQIECIISSATLYLGNITSMKVRIYPGFTYNTVPTNTIVKYRNIQLKAKDEEVSNFKGRYFQVTNVDLPKTSKNAETYDIYFQDNIDYIKANYNNFLYVGDSDIETQSWKRNTDTESNTLVVSVLKDKLAVTASYNDIFEGSVFGYIDFTKTPKLSVDNKRFLILSSEYNLQDNTSELTLVELKTNEISYNTNTTDDYGGNNTVNSTSSHGSFNLDANQVRKYVPEAGGNMYGDLLVTGTIDAVPTTSTDTLATNKGILDIGINFADIINIGSDTSVLNLFGDILVDKGLIQLNADGNTDIGFSVLTSDVESNYFKLISDEWVTDTGFKANYYDFNITNTDVNSVGRLRWNDYDGTLDLGLKGGNVTLQIGQEQVLRVSNQTGVNLLESNYQAVRVSGVQGNRLKVDLAKADSDANSAETIGIVTETINNNNQGFITTSGLVRNIDTTGALQGETWVDGDMLYLSPTTAGRLTNIKPQAPQHTVIMGYVVSAHQTQGQIFVKVDNGYELEELHNVKINSVADKDILTWNSTTNVWENLSLTELNGVNGNGTANYIAKWTDADTITNSIIFDNGTNVGIGTNTPFSKLILSGASGTSIIGIERSNPLSSGEIGAIGFKNTDATSPYLSAITSTFGANTTSSYLSFRLGTASASPFSLTEIARISSNGNFILGGTFTDLGLKFQVVGDSYFNGSIGIGSSSLTNITLRISKSLTTSTANVIYIDNPITSSVTSEAFFYRTIGNVQSNSTALPYIYHYTAGNTTWAGTATTQYAFVVLSSINNATNNYGFYGGIASGSNNNWNLYMAGTAPNYMAGSLGIGTTSLTGHVLRVSRNITGATTSYGIFQSGQVQTDVTTNAYGIYNQGNLASSTILTNYFHFTAGQGSFTLGNLTNQYLFYATNAIGGLNNYGFYGSLNIGSNNNWNLYMAGTAKNYLNGSLLIGTTTDSGYKLDVTGTARFTGTAQFDSIPTTSIVPSSANHIVNKAYVDSLALVKRGDNVKTISLSNITLSGTQTVNGVALVAGDYVLVAGQTNQTQNGVYVVASGTWTRSTTNDSDAEIRGAYHYITAGTYANQRYINTNTSAITVGTTNITYGIDFGAETDPIWTEFKTTNSISPTSVSNWNSAYTSTTNGTFYLATNPSNYITLSSLSAGTGLSYNAGVFSYTGTIYTDSSIRALISATSPITYNSSTGAIGISVANTTTDGYITFTDWNTFNNKLGTSTSFTLSGDVTGSGVYNSISTTVNAIKNKTIPTLASGVLRYDGTNFIFDNAFIKLTNLSSTATGLTYTNTTGVFSLTSGYSIPTTANQTNWTTAYNGSITAISISGTTSKTLTLTRQNDTPLSVSFSDLNAITSVNGLTGAVVLTTSNIAQGTNLYFTNQLVRDTTLAGYSVGANSAIASTDTILGAFGKIQGQINSINSSSKLITLSGDVTGSGNVGSTIATTINTSYSGFTNYYTKTATDTLLSGYYNKTATDALFANYYNKTSIDTLLNGYYTKTTIDSLLSTNYYTKTDTNTLLNSYYTKTESDNKYSLITHNHSLDSLSNVLITTLTNDNILKWNGAKWINTNYISSIGISVPIGLSVNNSPLTSSGTLAITFTNGYSIPTNTKQTQWDTAYVNRITSLTTTGSNGNATLISNVLNIPNYGLNFANYYTKTESDNKYSLLIHNHTLNSLSNVVITSNSIGEVLLWNGTNWINNTLTEAGISQIGHTHTTSDITNLSSYTGLDTRYYTQSQTLTLLNNKEDTITAGNTSQYWRGDKTWQLLSTDAVIEGQNNKYLTQSGVLEILLGSKYSAGSDVALTTTDTILSAFRKIQGQLNARLTQNQTITISGDASGSGNTSIALTLANSGVTAGTYRSVTVDAKGRVTAGTNPTTIAGYGITDLLSQTLTNFVTGTDTSIMASNTILGAFQVTQGQINARLSKSSITAGTNYILKHSGNYTLSNSLLYDTGTLIGIGTTSPTGRLHINSTIGRVLALQSPSTSGNNYIDFLNSAGTRTSYIGHGSSTTNDFNYYIVGTTSHLFYTNSTFRMIIDSSGNVGIGKSTPTYKLDITGDLNITSKIRISSVFGTDGQVIKSNGDTMSWSKLNLSDLSDGDDVVKYVLDNGEKGIKLYSNDSTSTTKDTVGFIFANEDTGILGIHGFALDSEENILEYGIQIDQDTNIYRLKSDGTRSRILTTDDSISSGGIQDGGTLSSGLLFKDSGAKFQRSGTLDTVYGAINLWAMQNGVDSYLSIGGYGLNTSVEIVASGGIYLQGILIDMNTYGVGKVLKATATNKAEWVFI